jgi:hypothetical protein
MKSITKDINYLSKKNISSLADYKKCLDKFSKNFDNEVALKTDTPIFLDTNVLLRYYSISFTAREKLLEFIKANKKRIILSSYVQYEFIKNREDVIQRFFEQVTNKIPKDFNSDVVNKMNSFLEQHKVVLKDYPFVETGIQKHKDELGKLFEKLNETAELKRKEHNDLIVKDSFLDLLNSCTHYDGLSEDELELIKKDFDLISKGITPENSDSIINKPNAAFPGLGDIKNKPDDPYGDYIIFHEMMKYMLNNKIDIIFLTFDNTKGDWMNKNRSPHLHYTQNIFANTGQILYIIDAERSLGELLSINIESLVSTENIEKISIPITIASITQLLENHKIFEGVRVSNIQPHVIGEFHINGYKTIEEIENDLDRAEIAIKEYRKAYGMQLSTVGVLRTALRIANANCKTAASANGEMVEMGEKTLEKYEYSENI